MAKELEVIQRQVGPVSPQQLPASNAGDRILGELHNFMNMGAGIAQNVATEQAAIEGVQARSSNKPYNLYPSFNKPTAAFNQAYRATDARIVTDAGIDQLAKTLVDESDPRKLSPASIASFTSRAQGILEGTASAALPENQFAVAQNLTNAITKGQVQLQGAIIDMENAELKRVYEHDFNKAMGEFQSAIVTSDSEGTLASKQKLSDILGQGSVLSQEIARQAPQVIDRIEKTERIYGAVAGLLEAQAQGKEAEWVSNFFDPKNNNTGLKNEMERRAAGDLVLKFLNQSEDGLARLQGYNIQELNTKIDNPFDPDRPSSMDELVQDQNFVQLNGLQQRQAIHRWVMSELEHNALSYRVAETFKQAAMGRADQVSVARRNEAFEFTRSRSEAELGRRLTVPEQFGIVQKIGANVPMFDTMLSTFLKTNDMSKVLEASQIYAAARNYNNKQKLLIDISGPEQVLAVKVSGLLNLGADLNEQLLQGFYNEVMRSDEAVIRQRLDEANKEWHETTRLGPYPAVNGEKIFRVAMAADPNAFRNNGAFAHFKTIWFGAKQAGSSKDEATWIAQNAMRNWTTSPYWINGHLNHDAPDKSFPISYGTHAVDNQIAVGLRKIAANNNRGRKPEDGPADRLANLRELPASVTEKQRVEMPFVDKENTFIYEHNGVLSEAKLLSDENTNAFPGNGKRYGVLVKNNNGFYERLIDNGNMPDRKNPDPVLDPMRDGYAYVFIRDLDGFAPNVFRHMEKESVKQNYINAELAKLTYEEQVKSYTGLLGGVNKFLDNMPVLGDTFKEIGAFESKFKAARSDKYQKLKDVPAASIVDKVNEARTRMQEQDFQPPSNVDNPPPVPSVDDMLTFLRGFPPGVVEEIISRYKRGKKR